MPNTGKATLDIKIYGLAYPHCGFFGLIEEKQKPPTTALFDPEEYPFLHHTWTMSPSINEKGEFNPHLDPKKKSNVLKIHIEASGS